MKVTVHGIETQYQQMGQGFPLVLLHGWGCDWQIWYPVIQSLSEHYQLILPDLPAFGQSANPPLTWTSKEYVEWLNEFVQHLKLKKGFALIGHSFGGKIASLYAASAKDSSLKKLILVDASGLPDPLSATKQLQQNILSLIPVSVKNLFPNQLKQKLLQLSNSSSDHFLSSPTQRQILRNTIRESVSEEVKKINVPTLLIWGKQDVDTPLHQGQKFQQLIPGSELSIFTQSGHFPFLDEASHFMTEVSEFCT